MVMATENRIKIVKRLERHERQTSPAQKSSAHIRNSADAAKRDAVTIVTGWVRELRGKKVAEAARGFESLFSQSAASATRV
jgi:hypothetical protein